jgi:hypothetical protein
MTPLLLFLLTCLMPMDDSGQLQTYIKVETLRSESQIGVSCEVFPKTLTVGDMLYVKAITKNISQEPLEYAIHFCTLGSDNFLMSASIQRSNTMGPVGTSFGPIVYPTLNGGYTPLRVPTNTLQPGNTLASCPRPFFVPTPNQYDSPLWVWNDLGKEERVLLTIKTLLYSIRMDESANSTIEKRKSESYRVEITQELKIKPRPNEELQLIKEWFERTREWRNIWKADSPTAAEWREFEEKLTPGTLRNHIRMICTLVEIAQDENKEKRKQMFDEMLEWINELHPFEKESLIKRAYEIIKYKPQGYLTFGDITTPETEE